jgi:hypothetical protein
MLDVEMIVFFIILSVLFLRQFAIYKQPSKINYAPLLIVIGVSGSLLHFMLHPQSEDITLLLRESAIPLFVSLMMYFILNILNQAQHSSSILHEEALRQKFLKDMQVVKEELSYLSEEITAGNSASEMNSFQSVRTVFQEDIAALHVIQDNQKLFLQKFEDMMARQHDGLKSFEEFSTIKMPEFDTIIHRHIEMLRIAEQDHFNKIKTALESTESQKCDVNETLGTILSTLNSLQNSSDSIAKSVLEQTTGDLTRIFSEYESYLNRLHAQSETLSTSIKESEALLFTLKERSESVVQQMVVVSKNMDKIHANTQEVGDINVPIEKLSSQVSRLEHESITIKDEINAFSKQLETLKKEELAHREHEIEQLSVSLNDKIDATLEKLYEQYHLAQNDISSTVKELASRSKLQQTYLSDSQK